ncbi:MAG: hypothetical protein V4572_12030 [Bacteroidota bacterium]
MLIKTPIPTLTLDVISLFISENYPDNPEIALKAYTGLLMYIQLYREPDEESESIYKNIHSDNLATYTFYYKKHITYKKIITDLVSMNLLVVNNKYRFDGEKSFTKSYFTTLLIDENFSQIDINVNFGNYRTKAQHLSKFRNFKKVIHTTYATKIDLLGYQNWLFNNLGTELKPKRKENVLIERVLTEEIAYRYLIRALKFNLGLHWFSHQKNSGRFYSSFTTLPGSSLDFTTIRGQKVVELDIKNAQPMFLIEYVDDEQYKYDVTSGVFYQKFMSELRMTKNKIKNMMYANVFFNDKKLLKGKLFNAFEKFYPGLIHEINILKMDELWLKLQKIESSLIIENFRKDDDCLTKHDAIIYVDNKEITDKYNRILDEFKNKNK